MSANAALQALLDPETKGDHTLTVSAGNTKDIIKDRLKQVSNFTDEQIEAAYAERMGGVLLGLFARCYLGAPYVDHRLTIVGRILEHYTAGDEVPAPFDGARGLARSSVYSYIEIYSDGEIVPVTADGTPA